MKYADGFRLYVRARARSTLALEIGENLCRTDRAVRVTVRFFGPAAESAGRPWLELDLTEGATVGEAVAAAVRHFPGLGPIAHGSMRYAVGTEYADPARALRDLDEVSFIPPVAGG